jgi:hypothetical protein
MPVFGDDPNKEPMPAVDPLRKRYRQLSPLEIEQVTWVKGAGEELMAALDKIGRSRELSLAKTKIEEAVMWATKAITR